MACFSVNSPVLLSVLYLGSGFGLTGTKQASVPDINNKMHPFGLQPTGTWSLPSGAEPLSALPMGRAMHKCHNKHLHLGNKKQSDPSLWFTQSRLTVSTDWVS